MNKLFKIQADEIANFLLNNKKGNCTELSTRESSEKEKEFFKSHPDGFVDIPIYEDKKMKIVYSYLIVDESNDDIIEQFFIYSNWWGKIKNSFFTINGDRGNFRNTKCGILNLNDLKDYYSGSSHEINNKNTTIDIKVVDFNSLVAYCQRKFKSSPSYGEVEVISQSPNPWVEVEIIMPDGNTYLHQGTKKQDAGNRFAVEYAKQNKL